MALDSGTSAPGHRGWIVYYSSPAITVTSRYVQNATGRYAVAQLDGVVRTVVRAHPARAAALFAGAVELVLAVPFAIGAGSATMFVVGLPPAFGVAVGVLVDARRNPRWMALQAVHLGRDVQLFCSRNQREFEQVRRALIRAIEISRDPRP